MTNQAWKRHPKSKLVWNLSVYILVVGIRRFDLFRLTRYDIICHHMNWFSFKSIVLNFFSPSSLITRGYKNSPRPGIEPGPPGWKPGILTPRPSGTCHLKLKQNIWINIISFDNNRYGSTDQNGKIRFVLLKNWSVSSIGSGWEARRNIRTETMSEESRIKLMKQGFLIMGVLVFGFSIFELLNRWFFSKRRV